jgi:hypothetical protein
LAGTIGDITALELPLTTRIHCPDALGSGGSEISPNSVGLQEFCRREDHPVYSRLDRAQYFAAPP